MVAATLTLETSILVEVAMTYLWSIRRNGTPLTLNGPVIKIKPESNCFKATTRLPAKRPARMMRTVPGVIDLRRATFCWTFLAAVLLISAGMDGANLEALAAITRLPLPKVFSTGVTGATTFFGATTLFFLATKVLVLFATERAL